MSGAGAWVWKYVLLYFSFKLWECVDRAYVPWEVVENVWGKIKWGWLKERSVRYRKLKRSSLLECTGLCSFWGKRCSDGVGEGGGGGGGGKFHAQVESPRGQLGIVALTPVMADESRVELRRAWSQCTNRGLLKMTLKARLWKHSTRSRRCAGSFGQATQPYFTTGRM